MPPCIGTVVKVPAGAVLGVVNSKQLVAIPNHCCHG